MSSPADLAERALAAATGPCIVLVDVVNTANLRWAANTLTTNGLTGSHEVTVIAVHDGDRAGVVSRSAIGPDDVAGLVSDAESAARVAAPAEDAAPLASGSADDAFGEAPAEVTPSDLGRLASSLGAAFDAARSGDANTSATPSRRPAPRTWPPAPASGAATSSPPPSSSSTARARSAQGRPGPAARPRRWTRSTSLRSTPR
jgi:hypothetical protein